MDRPTRAQIVERLWDFALRGHRSAIEGLMAAARLEACEQLREEFRAELARLQLKLSEIQAEAARVS